MFPFPLHSFLFSPPSFHPLIIHSTFHIYPFLPFFSDSYFLSFIYIYIYIRFLFLNVFHFFFAFSYHNKFFIFFLFFCPPQPLPQVSFVPLISCLCLFFPRFFLRPQQKTKKDTLIYKLIHIHSHSRAPKCSFNSMISLEAKGLWKHAISDGNS